MPSRRYSNEDLAGVLFNTNSLGDAARRLRMSRGSLITRCKRTKELRAPYEDCRRRGNERRGKRSGRPRGKVRAVRLAPFNARAQKALRYLRLQNDEGALLIPATLGQLAKFSPHDLLCLPGCGRATLTHIQKVLAAERVSLSPKRSGLSFCKAPHVVLLNSRAVSRLSLRKLDQRATHG